MCVYPTIRLAMPIPIDAADQHDTLDLSVNEIYGADTTNDAATLASANLTDHRPLLVLNANNPVTIAATALKSILPIAKITSSGTRPG